MSLSQTMAGPQTCCACAEPLENISLKKVLSNHMNQTGHCSCPMCPLLNIFVNEEEFGRHLTTVHPGYVKCPYCPVVTRDARMPRHIRRQHPEGTKAIAAAQVKIRDLTVNASLVSNGAEPCSHKSYMQLSIDDKLSQHMMEVHPKRYRCPECPVLAHTVADLNQHILKRHRGLLPSDWPLCSAARCHLQFTDDNIFKLHMYDIHISKRKCDMCAFVMVPSKYKRHVEIYHDRPQAVVVGPLQSDPVISSQTIEKDSIPPSHLSQNAGQSTSSGEIIVIAANHPHHDRLSPPPDTSCSPVDRELNVQDVRFQDETLGSPYSLIDSPPRSLSPSASILELSNEGGDNSVTLTVQVDPLGLQDSPVAEPNPPKSGLIFKATDRFGCRICHESPQTPVAIACGHIFCQSCITQDLVKGNISCIVCARPILMKLGVD